MITANPKRYVAAGDEGRLRRPVQVTPATSQQEFGAPAPVPVNASIDVGKTMLRTSVVGATAAPSSVLRHRPSGGQPACTPLQQPQHLQQRYARPPYSPVRTPTQSSNGVRAGASGSANSKTARPRSTQSMASATSASPQVWEQEVDDLLKWTEGLQDPLESSWGLPTSP